MNPIRLERPENEDAILLDAPLCIGCNACARDCPTQCITMLDIPKAVAKPGEKLAAADLEGAGHQRLRLRPLRDVHLGLPERVPLLGDPSVIIEELAFLGLGAIAVVTALARAPDPGARPYDRLDRDVLRRASRAIYFLLEAPFLGVLQLGVYAGAVTILLLFGVMVTRKRIFSREAVTGIGPAPLGLAGLTLAIVVVGVEELPTSGTAIHPYDPTLLSQTALQYRRALAPPLRPRDARRARRGDLPRPGGPRMSVVLSGRYARALRRPPRRSGSLGS